MYASAQALLRRAVWPSPAQVIRWPFARIRDSATESA